MTRSDDLAESLRHLEYEMALMVAAPRLAYWHPLRRTDDARPPGYYWSNDQAAAHVAGLESALTHARLLDDFFKRSTQTKPNGKSKKSKDRHALDYCPPHGWPGFDVLTDDEHKAIDKQLCHFGKREDSSDPPPIDRYARQAVKALALLTEHADPQWLRPLKTILAKAQAEQQRAYLPWNAHAGTV